MTSRIGKSRLFLPIRKAQKLAIVRKVDSVTFLKEILENGLETLPAESRVLALISATSLFLLQSCVYFLGLLVNISHLGQLGNGTTAVSTHEGALILFVCEK